MTGHLCFELLLGKDDRMNRDWLISSYFYVQCDLYDVYSKPGPSDPFLSLVFIILLDKILHRYYLRYQNFCLFRIDVQNQFLQRMIVHYFREFLRVWETES